MPENMNVSIERICFVSQKEAEALLYIRVIVMKLGQMVLIMGDLEGGGGGALMFSSEGDTGWEESD